MIRAKIFRPVSLKLCGLFALLVAGGAGVACEGAEIQAPAEASPAKIAEKSVDQSLGSPAESGTNSGAKPVAKPSVESGAKPSAESGAEPSAESGAEPSSKSGPSPLDDIDLGSVADSLGVGVAASQLETTAKDAGRAALDALRDAEHRNPVPAKNDTPTTGTKVPSKAPKTGGADEPAKADALLGEVKRSELEGTFAFNWFTASSACRRVTAEFLDEIGTKKAACVVNEEPGFTGEDRYTAKYRCPIGTGRRKQEWLMYGSKKACTEERDTMLANG